ncbi:MAG: MXAN_6577-like cysteine-rich protein, partial [Myxococcaceae bacterium]
GQSLCNGVCRSLQTDRFNCGTCGNVCQNPLVCTSGVCSCQPGLTRCGSACVNTVYDRNNCGGCGIVCASNLVCLNSVCTTP